MDASLTEAIEEAVSAQPDDIAEAAQKPAETVALKPVAEIEHRPKPKLEVDAERIRTSIARLTSNSIGELEGLAGELQKLDEFIKFETDRIQHDIDSLLVGHQDHCRDHRAVEAAGDDHGDAAWAGTHRFGGRPRPRRCAASSDERMTQPQHRNNQRSASRLPASRSSAAAANTRILARRSELPVFSVTARSTGPAIARQVWPAGSP